jgi:hypothetical protein
VYEIQNNYPNQTSICDCYVEIKVWNSIIEASQYRNDKLEAENNRKLFKIKQNIKQILNPQSKREFKHEHNFWWSSDYEVLQIYKLFLQ